MPGFETSVGGLQSGFPTTLWSDVLGAADPGAPEHRERMDRLLRAYWRPVYAYIRGAWRTSVEDAKDLAQAFFARVLEKGYLSRLRPERGSFRGYIKRALQHFLIDAKRAESARRPDRPMFRLDAAPDELERLGPASPDEPPERAYDREWFRTVMDSAIEALRESLAREGKERYFEAFRLYAMDAGEPAPGYREVAERVGVRPTDVKNYLTYCRAALRQLLRERICAYVAGDGDVESELEELLRG